MLETSRITKQRIVLVTTVSAFVLIANALVPALNNLIATPAYAFNHGSHHPPNFSSGKNSITSIINEHGSGTTNCKNGGVIFAPQFSSSVSAVQNCGTVTGTFSSIVRP